MAKTTASGKPKTDELPATLQRSDDHAQATFATVHDAAAEQYGDASRAHRVAYAALKHTYEKVGDHWERKGSAGPSDDRAAEGGLDPAGESAEGVDARATKEHLMGLARRLEVKGRSSMTKSELVEALKKANRRATARARDDG